MKHARVLAGAMCMTAMLTAYSSQSETVAAPEAGKTTTTTTTTVVNPDGSTTTTTTTTTGAPAKAEKEKVNYLPQIHGVIRARWEGEFGDKAKGEDGEDFFSRFMVRNARLNVSGKVLPQLSYFVQFDACDCGKMTFLDAYGKWAFKEGRWAVQAGQFRVPFGVDAFRAPGNYIFGNRSFVARYILNMRAVGAKAGYYGSGKLPLTVEAGIFNSADKSVHNVWQREYNYAAKASYKIGNVKLTPSFISYCPDQVRINLVGAAVTWQTDRFILEGEYTNKHYTNHALDATQGWEAFGSYNIPLHNVALNELSFQARYDGMTANSSGIANSEGRIVYNNSSRQRMTLGASIAHINGPVKGLVRVDYEKYFYKHRDTPLQGEDDKILVELVVKF